MSENALHVVTGAFGFTGKYITRRLLDAGHRVRTLTSSPNRPNPFGDAVEVVPYHWHDPDALTKSLRGADVLHNTYWVRYNSRRSSMDEAFNNTVKLFEAAARAGVRRIVHISITNPTKGAGLPYFEAKAEFERILRDAEPSHAILRPAVLFGKEGILINNIAWNLRRFPVFAVFGGDASRLRPIHVDDLAKLAVEYGQTEEDITIDAVGPETFTFRELVVEVGRAIGKPRAIIRLPKELVWLASSFMGLLLRDKVLTYDETKSLSRGLLSTDAETTGNTRLTGWLRENADWLGIRYMSELARRRDRSGAYEKL